MDYTVTELFVLMGGEPAGPILVEYIEDDDHPSSASLGYLALSSLSSLSGFRGLRNEGVS